MSKPFKIRFDFPLEHSPHVISVEATVQLHHSEPYYVVDSFHFSDSKIPPSSISLLPPQEIKFLKSRNGGTWVHKDSERASLLSLAIGKSIEGSGRFPSK